MNIDHLEEQDQIDFEGESFQPHCNLRIEEEWDWEDENGNKWVTVCGGPPQLYSDVRCGGPGSFVNGERSER